MRMILFILLGTAVSYSFSMYLKAPTKAQLEANVGTRYKKSTTTKTGWLVTSIFLLILMIGIMFVMFLIGQNVKN